MIIKKLILPLSILIGFSPLSNGAPIYAEAITVTESGMYDMQNNIKILDINLRNSIAESRYIFIGA